MKSPPFSTAAVTPVLVFENDLNDAINKLFDAGKKAHGIIQEIERGDVTRLRDRRQ